MAHDLYGYLKASNDELAELLDGRSKMIQEESAEMLEAEVMKWKRRAEMWEEMARHYFESCKNRDRDIEELQKHIIELERKISLTGTGANK